MKFVKIVGVAGSGKTLLKALALEGLTREPRFNVVDLSGMHLERAKKLFEIFAEDIPTMSSLVFLDEAGLDKSGSATMNWLESLKDKFPGVICYLFVEHT